MKQRSLDKSRRKRKMETTTMMTLKRLLRRKKEKLVEVVAEAEVKGDQAVVFVKVTDLTETDPMVIDLMEKENTKEKRKNKRQKRNNQLRNQQ